jgi:hypothetical protein
LIPQSVAGKKRVFMGVRVKGEAWWLRLIRCTNIHRCSNI